MQLTFEWHSPASRHKRLGRPRAARVIVHCHRCGAQVSRYARDVAKRGIQRHFCAKCYQAARREGLNNRRRLPDSKIRELDRSHNGRPVRTDRNGYVAIYEPDRAFTDNRKRANTLPMGFYWEHRIVMERILGRRLNRNEVVHHRNGIRTDNRIENLQLVTTKEHRQIHNDEITEKLRRLALYEERYGSLDDEPSTREAADASKEVH